MIEKVGHSRTMREQRLSWIEETKRKNRLSQVGGSVDTGLGTDAVGGNRESQKEGGTPGDNQDDNDLYSLPQQRVVRTDPQDGTIGEPHASSSGALFLPRDDGTSDDEDFGAGPNDDELDELMDIERAVASAAPFTNPAAVPEGVVGKNAAVTALPLGDDFEDEMEAMADFGPPPEW